MIGFVDQLIALFNKRSLDLPDGYFTRQTQFLLNGIPFEELLGRPPGDPLVLMLARGPAGYRFALKALQHAVPDGMLQRGAAEGGADTAGSGPIDGVLRGEVWLSGHFRGTNEPAELLMAFELVAAGGALTRASLTLDDAALEKVRAARLRA